MGRRITLLRVRLGAAQQTDERAVNAFITQIKVRKIVPALVQNAIPNYWSLYVEYDENDKEPESQREDVLESKERALYEALRQWRNRKAIEERILPYQIFHNAHLRQMIKNRVATIEDIAAIRGVGMRCASTYGPSVLKLLAETQPTE